MKSIRAFVLAHGHLDIEWYLPMRGFRFWTLNALDRQIELYRADPEVVSYTVDGQMFPLLLYLQSRPEKTALIREMIANGRLNIGPFYTQFDEWLPSGESMVRNCLLGKLESEALGERMSIGYLPDNFGHPAQLPQILNGFGIHSLLFMRGMPYVTEDYPDEFRFEGLDGSRLTAIHFRTSYSSMFTRDNLYEGVLHDLPIRDTPYYKNYISSEHIESFATIDDPQAFARRMIAHVRRNSPLFPSGIVPVIIGSDHCPPHAGLRQAMELANNLAEDIEFYTASPDEYLAEVERRNIAMPVYKGELNGSRFQYALYGAFSTRAYLKRMNFAAEAMLERYAEPLDTLAKLHGAVGEKAMLDEAWKLLLTNHAHDSIHGSSVDEVHAEMIPRFDGALQIGSGLAHRALAALAAHRANPRDGELIIFRPCPSAQPQFAEQWLQLQDQHARITDNHGQDLASQILRRPEIELNELGEPRGYHFPSNSSERVLFEVPAGAGSLSIARVNGGESKAANTFACDAGSIENEHLRVVARGALVDLYDKISGQWYKGLNLIHEQADTGDYWDFSPTWLPSEEIYSNRGQAACELVETGPVRASLRIRYIINVPERFQDGRRSDQRVDLPVTLTVSLWKNTRRLDVKLELNNTARDHKLSLHVQPRIQTQEVISKTVFGILHRSSIVKPALPGRSVQPEGILYPFREWAALQDQNRGLAVVVKGLYEYEADIDKYTGQTILQLTLLRSVGNMNRNNTRARQGIAAPDLESEGAQCLGPQLIEYAYLPYTPLEDGYPFLEAAEAFLYPPLAHRILSLPAVEKCPVLETPFTWDEKNIAFSAFKRAENGDGYILRLYEQTGKPAHVALCLNGFRDAVLCRLDESDLTSVEIQDGCAQVDFAAHQIISLRLRA